MKLRYIALRLVKTVLVAIAVVLLSFFLIRLAPGDAATVMAGQSGYADEAFMKSLRAEYGLDQPLPVQLWKYVDAVAHGDLGKSYVRRQPAQPNADRHRDEQRESIQQQSVGQPFQDHGGDRLTPLIGRTQVAMRHGTHIFP